MAGWSSFADESPLDCCEVEMVDGYNCDDHCLVKDNVDSADPDIVKQEILFHRVFLVYLKEKCSKGIARPMPVLLGNGQPVDLYKLFFLVKEIGGYVEVSKEGLWGYVIDGLGLDHQSLVSLKLIYGIYLNGFEEWIKKTFDEKNTGCESHGFKTLPLEMGKEFRDLLCLNLNEKDDRCVQLDSNTITKSVDLDSCKGEANILGIKNQSTCEDVHNVHGDDDDEKALNGVKNDVATSAAEVAGNGFGSCKRKREPLSGMLNWIKQIAKHPLVPLMQPIPKPSKWKEYNKGQDFFIQLVRAREVLSLGPCIQPNSEASSSQKLKMHPAMYEDHVAPRHNSTGKLRCSERLPTYAKSRICACCNSCSANGNRSTNSVDADAEKCPVDETTATIDVPPAKMEKITTYQPEKDIPRKQVPVGPFRQAEVPEWTGEASESDSKWYGTRLWPPKHDLKPPTETDLVGRGREENCGCDFEGSVECVRFHIAENRKKLRLELGTAFYYWGFDCMGEEISFQWTTKDARWFKDLMMINIPSQNKYFWSSKSKYFPKKTRKSLVCYYFNVYLIELRRYQNRATPWSIDSDKDEEEFGSFGEGFGAEAIKVPGSDFLECSVNKQCFDLEGKF